MHMNPQSSLKKLLVQALPERLAKDIRRATRRHLSTEDKSGLNNP